MVTADVVEVYLLISMLDYLVVKIMGKEVDIIYKVSGEYETMWVSRMVKGYSIYVLRRHLWMYAISNTMVQHP